MIYACDTSKSFVISSFEGGALPYEKWCGRKPSLEHLSPFDTVGYARRGKRAHKLAPKGEQCTMLGIAHSHPRGEVQIIKTGEIVHRQNVS